MPVIIQPVIPERAGHSPSQSKQAITNPADEQAAPARHRIDNTLNSASSFGSEKWVKGFGTSTLESELAIDDLASPPRLPTETIDGETCPTRKRAAPGRWRRFYLDWLTLYRLLIFSVVFINLVILISQTVVNPVVEALLTATAANIMAAVLLRQEEVINTSFMLVSRIPSNLPFACRKTVGDFHHYGGLHVGCALSALLWYIAFAGLNTVRVFDLLQLGNMTKMLYIDIIVAYAALLAILFVCITATPRLRVQFHNTFEATHRFGGWAALLVLWIHAGITSLTLDTAPPLYTLPSVWMLAITTLIIILPWLRIRRVSINTYPVSAREIQLTFPYASMPYTSTIRISTRPLTEWHAFATIPVSSTTCKMIISQAGDWTRSIITSPPEQIWIRHPPMLNFLAFAPLFNSLLLVATGAGIGPMLSLLTSPFISRMLCEGRKIKVMWCAYEPHVAHWAFVRDAIGEVDKQPRFFDSRAGRPDVAFEARWMAQTEGVEAVMVVSNPKVTKEVVDECKIAGLAAYGAVFDS